MTDQERDHELGRIYSLSYNALCRRISRCGPLKLRRFARVLEGENFHGLAALARNRLETEFGIAPDQY